ncbi:MAG: hypothetical protein HKM05_04325 [Spirochaetales bacterium]|nr:hypothetical protein [Spirochaetales bacterium]
MNKTNVVEILEQILQTSAPKPRDLLKLDFYRQAMILFQSEEAQLRQNGFPEFELEQHQAAHRKLFHQLKDFSGPWEEFRRFLETWQKDHEQQISPVLRS